MGKQNGYTMDMSSSWWITTRNTERPHPYLLMSTTLLLSYFVIVRSLECYSDDSFSIGVNWGESVVNTEYSSHMFSALRPRSENLARWVHLRNRCYLHIFVGDDRWVRTAVAVSSSLNFAELWAVAFPFRSAHNWNRPDRNRNRRVAWSQWHLPPMMWMNRRCSKATEKITFNDWLREGHMLRLSPPAGKERYAHSN